MDIVPSSWVNYDSSKKACMTFYPEPPYSNDDLKQLQKRVKKEMDPLSSWVKWPIILRGGASKK